MIAYHFPPLVGSSGIQRTLRFVQHLPSFGWEPLVLTVQPVAYGRTSQDLNGEVPRGIIVRRAFALDTARHLSLGGRYIAATARPDRWVSWRFDGLRQGLKLVRQFEPMALWSTYPIATAHRIGAALHHRTGLPWLADFRDPMAQDGYPADPRTWKQYRDIESEALHYAACAVFTTPGAAADYRERYPDSASRIHILENGYDDEAFSAAAAVREAGPLNPGVVTLLHSGIVYPSERDPTQLLQALVQLRDAGHVHPGSLRIRFRAAVAEERLQRLAEGAGVTDFLEVFPPVPYKDALAEMLRADGLLLMQANNCNTQIPAKLYEYLRAERPILCLTDPAGDTAAALRAAGINAIARLDDPEDIAQLIARFLGLVPDPPAMLADPAYVRAASRRSRTEVLARLLDKITSD